MDPQADSLEKIQKDLDNLWVDHRQLRQDFYTHDAVGEERWKTIFNEFRELRDTQIVTNQELKARIESLHKLVITVSGTTIVFLAGTILSISTGM